MTHLLLFWDRHFQRVKNCNFPCTVFHSAIGRPRPHRILSTMASKATSSSSIQQSSTHLFHEKPILSGDERHCSRLSVIADASLHILQEE